jgi:subtilisin family serine protease
MTVANAMGKLKVHFAVEYAEPNWVYYHDATSNDTYYTNRSLWGMYGALTSPANQYGSGAAAAWANGKTDCSSVYVGIIDEGYMHTHPDLAANAGTNPGEIVGNGRDDDGNGYVDDVYGWDFDGNNNTVFDGAGDDHGSHVAGTIGGVGGNGAGVAGVCWSVKLMNAKFLGRRGGTTANAIKAVDYFTNLKTSQGLNFVATNNSWGGGGYSQALYDAIERANAADILFIAAAGNSSVNNDSSPHYPSSYSNPNIIAVASITNTGALSSFSNYGATSVDIGAPGSGIWSTVPVSSKGSVVAGYASYSGTSMATPHVAGAAALYASQNPGASAAQIRSAILNSATPTSSLSGKTATGARLNVSGF